MQKVFLPLLENQFFEISRFLNFTIRLLTILFIFPWNHNTINIKKVEIKFLDNIGSGKNTCDVYQLTGSLSVLVPWFDTKSSRANKLQHFFV